MKAMAVDYRLVPTIIREEMETEPVHHTERGDFNFCTYVEQFDMGNITIIDMETGEQVDFAGKYAITAIIFWMGHPIQKHTAVAVKEDGEIMDTFEYDEAVFHSQALHNSFGMYMDGFESVFPKYRAFGWAFLSPQAIIAIQMWEHRAFQQASMLGNFALDDMIDWAEMTGEIEFDEKPPMVEPINSIPQEDPMGVNHNLNVQDFMKQMEEKLASSWEETDDNNEGRTDSNTGDSSRTSGDTE